MKERTMQPRAERFELPDDLQARIKRVAAKTGMSYRELFQKWLSQEEIGVEAQNRNEELLQWQQDIESKLNQVLQQNQGKSDPVAGNPSGKKEGKSHKQMLLAKVRTLKAKGAGLSDIARQFNEEGVVTVSGRGKWHPSTVSQLLGTEDASD